MVLQAMSVKQTTGVGRMKRTRKRIGMLYPSPGLAEEEAWKLLPEGVSLHIARVPMVGGPYEAVSHMADNIGEVARLVADAGVDIIGFNCTVGSLIHGKGYDEKIMDKIKQATGTQATTTTTAVVAGLRALGIKKLVQLIPALVVEATEKEKRFLEDAGFQVLRVVAPRMTSMEEEYETEPSYWHRLMMENQEPQADGYFMSCAGIRVVDVIEQAEADLGKPVVTSNQAFVWHCLRKMGVEEPIQGFGRLLETPL